MKQRRDNYRVVFTDGEYVEGLTRTQAYDLVEDSASCRPSPRTVEVFKDGKWWFHSWA